MRDRRFVQHLTYWDKALDVKSRRRCTPRDGCFRRVAAAPPQC